ncbi:hypothetical protein GUJ93_ZPchr0012g18884 [Zizania palustris]|uniref:Uncharacterized protein n=1 Tax=Zizania palustris TaxID=103762 RepID=A0A8J6BVX1_ZIZPA|nr:hypothetical protein GUJ93_ZPchr0012g18884 [Zizania palustris]
MRLCPRCVAAVSIERRHPRLSLSLLAPRAFACHLSQRVVVSVVVPHRLLPCPFHRSSPSRLATAPCPCHVPLAACLPVSSLQQEETKDDGHCPSPLGSNQ